MPKCVVGRWRGQLDAEDREAFERAAAAGSRIDLYVDICTSHGGRPFSLTAMKDCINGRCVCD
jgi:hypothetical protein